MTTDARLTSRRLSIAAAWRALDGAGTGAVVAFAGRVRPDRGPSGPVIALVYEAHAGPALARFRALGKIVHRRFGAGRAVLWHRVGRVPVGELSVIVGVACAHRSAAFAANRYLIESLKATVPIWKEERARSARRPRRHRPARAARSAG